MGSDTLNTATEVRNIRSELSGYKGGLCKKKDCKYKVRLSGMRICDYITIGGKMRGCPADQCDKYEKGKRKPAKRRVKKW